MVAQILAIDFAYWLYGQLTLDVDSRGDSSYNFWSLYKGFMAETRHSLYNFLPFSITDLALSLTWKFEDKCAVNFSGSGKFSKLFHTLWCECRGCWIPRCAQDGVVHTAHCTCSWCFLFLFYQKIEYSWIHRRMQFSLDSALEHVKLLLCK